MSKAPVIWLNAFPGTGKLTVARSLVELSGNTMILIANHSLIDPVETKMPRDHPSYQKERRLQRSRVFCEYVANPQVQSSIIFTDFQSDNDLGRTVAGEYQSAATDSGRPFLPVYLSCDLEENIQRIQSLERVGSQTTKLLDPTLLRDIRNRSTLFHFQDVEGLSLNITGLTPAEAASAVLDYVTSRLEDHSRLGSSQIADTLRSKCKPSMASNHYDPGACL